MTLENEYFMSTLCFSKIWLLHNWIMYIIAELLCIMNVYRLRLVCSMICILYHYPSSFYCSSHQKWLLLSCFGWNYYLLFIIYRKRFYNTKHVQFGSLYCSANTITKAHRKITIKDPHIWNAFHRWIFLQNICMYINRS